MNKTRYTLTVEESGLNFYSAYVERVPVPVGVMWGYHHYNKDEYHRFDIAMCYTLPYHRRKGIQRGMINQLFLIGVEAVITDAFSDEGGKEFCEGMGFKRGEETKLWYLTKPKEKEESDG